MERQNDILGAAEAAKYLGISKGLLYKLTSAKRIPHYKPCGKRVFFRASELDRWIDKGRIATNAELKGKGGNND